MYYCSNCAKAYSYTETYSQAFGRCEICFIKTNCSVMADKSLINIHRNRRQGLQEEIEEIFKAE